VFYALTIEEDILGGVGTNPWGLGDRLRVDVDDADLVVCESCATGAFRRP
jgi:hypothetical protein